MPSGMLWRAIPIDKVTPNLKLLLDDIKVMIPSGILWSVIDVNNKKHLFKLYSVSIWSSFSSNLFEIYINNPPIIKLIITINTFLVELIAGNNKEKKAAEIFIPSKTLCLIFLQRSTKKAPALVNIKQIIPAINTWIIGFK